MTTQVSRKPAHATGRSGKVVRRYQDRPKPLVRDRRRGFRTGRLDLVLAGHFDLMEG